MGSCVKYTALIMAYTIFLCCLLLKPREAEAALTHKDELAALKIIAGKLGIVDWDFSADPCTGKAGIYTDNSAFQGLSCGYCNMSSNVCHVTNITLPGLNLTGVLPPELADLSYLSGLDVTDNYLTGPIPIQLGSLSSLRNLSLARNFLSGPVPKELGSLTSLVELSVHSNNLSGTLPSEIGKLTTLQNLYLSSNQFIGEIPSSFAQLKNLKRLVASSNGFIGKIPDFFGSLTTLIILMLQGTSLKGPMPSTFSDLTKMEDLRISDITQGGSSLDFISSLKDLRILVLRNNFITAQIPNLSGLRKLQTLDLSFNNLVGEIPPSLNLEKLQFVFLGNNSLTGSLPSWLSDSKATIDLSYNKFRGDIPTSLTGENSNVNLVGNNMSGLTDHNLIFYLQRKYLSNEQAPNYRLAINCGGPQLKTSNQGLVFDEDDAQMGASAVILSRRKSWGVGNIGLFIESFIDGQPQLERPYTITSISAIDPLTSVTDPQLYRTARASPTSLRYYGLGLQNGPYSVELHFAELQFLANKTSKGKRIFDVYIQGKNVLKDFNIKETAGENHQVVIKKFLTNVTENLLEIHFFWAGKGTCCEPQDGTYGPLVSAIKVDPEFKPHIPKNTKTIKIVIIVVGIMVTLGILLILSLIFMKKTKKWHNIFSFVTRDKDLMKMEGNTFSLRVMKIATENFDHKNKIGEGGFGAVYKGILPGGRQVAIKQLSSLSKQGNREFLNEVSTISAVKHPNLVKLYGCCVEGGELLLVYEYIENNNLARALFGPDEARIKLDWPSRQRICLGVARGLAYLHEESLVRIVHRDIKSTNILLDKHLNPKIADFGLARLFDEEHTHVSTRIAGTIGYLAPEYALKGHLSEKSDVYSFGVVVLEVVSGRIHTDIRLEEGRNYLLEWAWQLYEEKKMPELIDANLVQSGYNEEEVVRMIHVGLLCTHENPGGRPSMSAIVEMLEGTLETPAPKSRPGYLSYLEGWDIAAGVHHVQAQSSTSKSSSSNNNETWNNSKSFKIA